MKTIEEYNKEYIKNKTKTLTETYETILDAKQKDQYYNMFVSIIEDPVFEEVDSKIAGVPCAVKDNFSTKDLLSTGSSNILKDYVPVFDATVVKKLKEAGSIIIGKTVLDELGMGGTGTTGHTGVVKNALNSKLISGGSSAGSAVAVALDVVPFAIGSDTGDSVRKPAAYNNIVGYKPSYGLISRYGLFPFACSLDTVGVLTKKVKDAAIVTDIIKGKDSFDMTSVDSKNMFLEKSLENSSNNKKLFYIKEFFDLSNYKETPEYLIKFLTNFNSLINDLRLKGYKIEEVSIDKKILNAINPTYMIISSSEATSNYSNLNGIIFGPRAQGDNVESIMKNARTQGFCSLIKRRFIIGSYALERENQEKYFLNAKRVRRLITNIFNDLFKTYDGFIMPVGTGYIPEIEEDFKQEDEFLNALDNILQIGNFGGYPSITIPTNIASIIPFCINITSGYLKDETMFSIATDLEKIFKGSDDNV